MAAEEIYEEEAALFEQVSSCFHFPNTPEQNGLAERKHRHIEEMGLTLLTQAQHLLYRLRHSLQLFT